VHTKPQNITTIDVQSILDQLEEDAEDEFDFSNEDEETGT
jgi:hypothetical protein